MDRRNSQQEFQRFIPSKYTITAHLIRIITYNDNYSRDEQRAPNIWYTNNVYVHQAKDILRGKGAPCLPMLTCCRDASVLNNHSPSPSKQGPTCTADRLLCRCRWVCCSKAPNPQQSFQNAPFPCPAPFVRMFYE